ncbi:uncharacterized protein FIBRA_02403 [Fibroporia radiculosa]|uniref:VLRF1 domain-containing protein n=1 Tax=Fibroporia radiculosa TaxID=599839 RepID=J4G1N7_9APHY|nr:uncharacterized protein FIBRA_02403 [Fibroporia radiculosa]CCM00373.1 predicted protein [Fibroporia radiculosa]
MSFAPYYHIFSLPKDLLDTIIPRDVVNQAQASSSPHSESSASQPSNITGARACNVCPGTAFVDVDAQRYHFRSDWHRYNVKAKLNGGDGVTESQFGLLVDGLEDSLSGSASSSDGESDDSDAVATLIQRTRILARSPSPTSASLSTPQTPLAWFHSPPSTQIGIYKALFPLASSSSYLNELKEMQKGGEEGRSWAMFLVAGGHFAGAIVRVKHPDGEDENQGSLTKKGKPRKLKPDTEVLKHKTFHRYTTRRKQGGSQSVNDNAKSKAVSAGAMLRRYGEQALRDDIRSLLQDWAEEIEQCELIWIRASVSNRRIFLDYDGAIITKGDSRLRTFPFPTRRPTQSELYRCLLELTRVKVSHFTEDVLREQDEAYLASLPKPRPKPTMVAPKLAPEARKEKPRQLSAEEQQLRSDWNRLLEMVTKGRLESLKTFWEREGNNLGNINVQIPEWANERGGTLLQVAARAGQPDVTQWLLEDMHADPTLDVPANGGADEDPHQSDMEGSSLPAGLRRTAYDLARSRAVRDVYRRCAAIHPDWWDWLGIEKGARVPSILSADMEDNRDEKKKVRRKGLKDRIKDRETKEKELPVISPTSTTPFNNQESGKRTELVSGPRRLGGSAGASEGIVGLTPEMRAKVERERRARAAEARLKALGGVR